MRAPGSSDPTSFGGKPGSKGLGLVDHGQTGSDPLDSAIPRNVVLFRVTKARRSENRAMKKHKFKAKIEAGDGGGAYVLFPYDTEKEFATKGKVPVKATFNGVPYTGSLIKYGNPLHMMGVLKSIREQIGKGPGDTIEVVVWRDEEVRTARSIAAGLPTPRRKTRMLKKGISTSGQK